MNRLNDMRKILEIVDNIVEYNQPNEVGSGELYFSDQANFEKENKKENKQSFKLPNWKFNSFESFWNSAERKSMPIHRFEDSPRWFALTWGFSPYFRDKEMFGFAFHLDVSKKTFSDYAIFYSAPIDHTIVSKKPDSGFVHLKSVNAKFVKLSSIMDEIVNYLNKFKKIRMETDEFEHLKLSSPSFKNVEYAVLRGINMLEKTKKLTDSFDLISEKKILTKDEDPCWDNYRMYGMKNKDDKKVPNCVKEDEETYDGNDFFEEYGYLPWVEENINEAEYHGRTVKLNKPMRGDVKKFKVYVKDPETGNIKKVNFGDPDMKIKKHIPARRKSFRARHNCDSPGPKTKARYWSCKMW